MVLHRFKIQDLKNQNETQYTQTKTQPSYSEQQENTTIWIKK